MSDVKEEFVSMISVVKGTENKSEVICPSVDIGGVKTDVVTEAEDIVVVVVVVETFATQDTDSEVQLPLDKHTIEDGTAT